MKFKDLKGYLIAVDLDGTLIQNFDDYEIICVDDCSTDSSLEILKDFAIDKIIILV